MSQPAAPAEPQPTDLLAAGRDAFARHAWTEAFDLLSQAEREGGLSGEDLENLAVAAFFSASAQQVPETLERAFKAYQARNDSIRAAYTALAVADSLGIRGKHSLASAWIRRAERLLEGQPENYAHAYLALMRSWLAREAGEIDRAMSLAEEAIAIAARTGHADLRAMAEGVLGTLRIATGATLEGVGLLEEATIAAVNGELSPFTAGVASCRMIAACRDLTDYQRANEWLDATDRWCERQEVSGFPGICRIHRAEILALRGGWEQAEQELRKATSELAAYEAVPPIADGMYAIGDIRRLMGDLEGAESALREAHALGRTPQPALALIRLAGGKANAAVAAIDAALAEPIWDQWARARLLAAQVEITLAAGQPERARMAADELARIVDDYRTPALMAGRAQAAGRVLLAEGDPQAAAGELRSAIRLWRDVGAPYEVARVRAVLSRALRALGNEDDADLELRAARDEFERLGARPDLEAAEAELQAVVERRSRPEQVRRAFLFTDIVGSTNLAEVLGDEAWERLLAWHDAALRDRITGAGGRIVNSTGDGFFAAFETARRAIDCAIAIQQALDEHRRTSGFAPQVRIGVHCADANRRGEDYSGIGVNVAARIAALATGGEILASSEALTEAGQDVAAPRQVTVKGVSAPIAIAAVPWSPRG